MTTPLILQFGTSRFLQAHVDYFVGKSLEAGTSQHKIVVVQSSDSPAGRKRVSAFNGLASYPVVIQGIRDGETVDRVEQIGSIEQALIASEHWDQLVALFCSRVTHLVSNTADQGYQLDHSDSLEAMPGRSFPAKLLQLLWLRFSHNAQPLTLMPCELIANNGDVLQQLILDLAASWQMDSAFIDWLRNDCLWVNSLVDRIVSAPLDPVGAVAEPYALWAIEEQPGLELPCQHPAIRQVPDLAPLEWLKLGILNLSHTYLVDLWQRLPRNKVETVSQAMNHPPLREALESLLQQEVIPLLQHCLPEEDVSAYAAIVRERFLNPFLQHKLADIAVNHPAKLERRLLPIWQQRQQHLPLHPMPRLQDCLTYHGLIAEVADV